MDQQAYYLAKLAWEIDAADLREALDKSEHFVVVDARNAAAYSQGHIPGAMSLPHRNMDAAGTQNLNRDLIYVCYCDGIGCNASTKGALKMAQLGFQVRELIGGLDWWQRDGYAVERGLCETSARPAPANCGCN